MLEHYNARQHSRWAGWAMATLLGLSLTLTACDNGGGSKPQAAVSQPQTAAAPQDNPPPAATAYWPNGAPSPQASVVIPTAPMLPTSSANVLLQEDFHAPVSFTVVDLGVESFMPPSIWQVTDGRYIQQGDSAGNPSSNETLALTGDAAWTDYRIESEAFSGATPYGLIARYTKDGFYRLRVNRSGVTGPGWVLSRYDAVKNGYHITDLASGNVGEGYTRLQWNYLSLTVQGDKISVGLNGQTFASVTDNTYKAGSAGLYTEATGGAHFDNLRVTATQ